MRLALRGIVLAVLAAALVAGADAGAFELRARALEHSWQQDQVAGVPSGALAVERAQLRELRARRVGGLVPFEFASGALFADPMAGIETATRSAEVAARRSARDQAQAALARLEELGGPNYYPVYYAHLAALSRASRPADLAALTSRWEAEARQLGGLRDQLSAAAGGLKDGLPADVAGQVALLHSLEQSAAQGGLSVEPAPAAEADAQMYLAGQYADMVGGHDRISAELGGALTVLQKRVGDLGSARQALDQAQQLLPELDRYGTSGDFGARLQQLRQGLQGAPDDTHLAQSAQSAQALLKDMRQALDGNLPITDPGACIPGAPAQLIVIHLATQQLEAYTNGCPWLRTPVTTGRPALPTARGTFQIFAKYPAYKMVSPWPPGSPYWYPTTWVYNAMEFVGDGTFIHNANWEPAYAYGRGSEYGPYASHGCVHVLDGPLAQLYSWAPIGTTVTVED